MYVLDPAHFADGRCFIGISFQGCGLFPKNRVAETHFSAPVIYPGISLNKTELDFAA